MCFRNPSRVNRRALGVCAHSRISSAVLVRDSRMNSANGALGRHERQDSHGTRLVTAASGDDLRFASRSH
jgi:hypothetical protein